MQSSIKSDDGARRGSLYTGVDFPKDDEGRVHHLSVREGDVANRVVSVGDPTRATALAEHFDSDTETKRYDSHRPGAFTTFTGTFNGVPVSVIATGMGCSNMDFVVRETRGIVHGPMAFVRFGSCGIVDPDTKPGSICVSTLGSIMVTRNPDAFHKCVAGDEDHALSEYNFSLPVKANEDLSALLTQFMIKHIGADRAVGGMNATCDSFYSSQGRASNHFGDRNEDLIAEVQAYNRDIVTMEMETFHLLHLARCARKQHPIAASAAVICAANRHTGEIIEMSALRELESKGGVAVLEAITSLDIEKIS